MSKRIKFWDGGIYKYGFIVAKTKEIVSAPPVVLQDDWRIEQLPNKYHIAIAPEVKLCCKGSVAVWVCLCGNYCMDVIAGHMEFNLITENLLHKLLVSEQAFFEYLDDLNGRFACFYSLNNELYVLNDATGARSIYYSTQKPIIASHYNLIHDIVKTKEHPFYGNYCEWVSDMKKENRAYPWVMPGDNTPWTDIKILIANHKLKLPEMVITRFWPRQNTKDTNVTDATSQIAYIIKKEAETLSAYYRVYQSLTAGYDSRITLAATRGIKNGLNYFTYRDKELSVGVFDSEDRERNLNFAKNLCDKEKLKFKEITIPQKPLPEGLKKVLEKNHYHWHIPHVLIPYSKLFPVHSIHLRSNLIETIRSDAHSPLNKIQSDTNIGAHFAKTNRYSEGYKYFEEASKLFERFYFENSFDNVFDYPVPQLFYWEYSCSVWLSGAVLTITDLVVDTFQLFNCRKVLDIALGMPTYYRNRAIIYDRVVNILWPDLLDYGLPNNSEKIYNLINKNKIQIGRVNFDYNIKTFSGNIFERCKVNPPYLFEAYRHGACIGFSSNRIKKGDFCAIVIDYDVEKNKNYIYQFVVKTSYVQGAMGGISYEILINDKIFYKLPINAFYKTNSIYIDFKAESKRTDKIVVRVVADKDINESIYNSTIDILSMELSRDWSGAEHEYEPAVIDMYSITRQHNQKE